jgi:adenylate kinase family enzyme
MRRVAIIGPGGAGKTTLAAELGEILGIEVVQLDRLFWEPGWVKTSEEDCEAVQRSALAADTWVVDSAAPRALRARLELADTVIYLDLPLRLCALRSLRRRLRMRGRNRSELAPGCVPARVDRAALNYLHYVVRYRREARPNILSELDRLSVGRRIVVLRSRGEVRRFVHDLRRRVASDVRGRSRNVAGPVAARAG